DSKAAIARAIEMERAGANIIDIGGESTRPGAEPVSPQEQLERVIPVIENLNLKIPISIDSRSSEVVEKALKAGASMVNLVGGLNSEMAKILAQYEVPVILMHMLGEPDNMQDDPQYHDVMDEIMDWAREQIETAEKAGIGRGRIIIDPGIGFGKTQEHNLEIIRRLGELRILGVPILLGASRKAFIGKILDAQVDKRLEGSLAAAVLGATNGADMVRVHDIEETVKALAIAHSIFHA
ncbi:MAG: dihydropteroate synthase, partial [Thermoplasmata archaeon]|nr:dihydropteroate synthase [Thermoplasmata archaeon]